MSGAKPRILELSAAIIYVSILTAIMRMDDDLVMGLRVSISAFGSVDDVFEG